MFVIRYLLLAVVLAVLLVIAMHAQPRDSLCGDPPFAWIVGQRC